MTSRSIGIGVPVCEGSAFVAETLESILAQRDVRLRVFISVDGAEAPHPTSGLMRVNYVRTYRLTPMYRGSIFSRWRGSNAPS